MTSSSPDPKSNDTPRPLYQQVKDHILNKIRSGDWLPDARITSENRLVEALGVSRMTVNRALRELAAEGVLIRLQGVGTFVAHPKPRSELLEIQSIAREIRQRGGIYSCDIIRLSREKAGGETAAAMGLALHAPVFHLVMVHKDTGRPVQLADRFINPEVAPEFLNQDFTRTTPSEYLMSIARPTEVEHVIEAIMPDKATRDLLDISKSEPCLVLHRRTWVKQAVATRNRLIYPGSRHKIGGRFKPA